VLSSCDDSDDDDTMKTDVVNLHSSLTGAQEVPANNSQATANFDGSYDKGTKILSYTITFNGITPTGMHFHKGEVGQSGPIVVPIGSAPYTSPVQGQSTPLTADQETDLLAGKWYVNIHSSQFPNGEIRAQILP
jgi:hypothetical protein